MKTALIIVDMQNDFANKKGSLYVDGGEDIVEPINQLIKNGTYNAIAYTMDWHPATTTHFKKDGGTWPVHCVEDTWGAQFFPTLDPDAGPVFVKGNYPDADGYSGFGSEMPDGSIVATGLGNWLKNNGIRLVTVVGLATDYCVKETVLDALRLGYTVFAPKEIMRAVDINPGDGESALKKMEDAGARFNE